MRAGAGLTRDQVDAFHREGYLAIEQLFDEGDLRGFTDDLDAFIDDRSRALVAAGALSQTYADEPFTSRLARITEENEDIYWAINGGRLSTRGIFDLMTHPNLLAVAESLVGPEIIASSVYRLRPKLPGFWHGVVPWHQDSGYFEPYCDTALILTVWIPLVDATVDRGCLEVLPRVHRGEVARHRPDGAYKGYLRIHDEDLPDAPGEAVPVPVPRGGALLLTNRTPHRSTENRSDVTRWSLDVRFQSADLPTNYQAPSGWHSSELPGDAPAACYPPEADFLVRSRDRPSDVVRDWATFTRLRESHPVTEMTDRWNAGFSAGSYHQSTDGH